MVDGQNYPLRYICIETPEQNEPYAEEATAANRNLVGGQTVYLEKDVSETDQYDRLLRYVYLPDGTFVNAELVRQGCVVAVSCPAGTDL
jgi:micrococcal nuclease